MYHVLLEVISHWDPIGLMDHCPSNEYDIECSEIINKLEGNTQNSLGDIIYIVFKEQFGDIFQEEISKCAEIASLIQRRLADKG